MSRNVSKAPRESGQKASRKPTKKLDHRVHRTRNALGDALVQLMHEKAFDQITVQHVLDRAGVSRSTFYAHYCDKDDLFLSDAEDFFEMMAFRLLRPGEASRRIAPVREMFGHLAEWHDFYRAMVAAGKAREVLELGQDYFARAIERRLAELDPLQAGSASRRTPTAQMLAGALFSLLTWWIRSGMTATPSEMDDFYHAMVWSSSAVGAKRARSFTSEPPPALR